MRMGTAITRKSFMMCSYADDRGLAVEIHTVTGIVVLLDDL